MLDAIHTPETGEIHQANKVYVEDLKSYESLLSDLGHTYVKANSPGLLPPEYWYVSGGSLTERPAMRAAAFAPIIRAGTNALILDIPKGAAVAISAAGAVIHSIPKLDGDELEFSIPVPCKYRAVITLWPFKDCMIDIEAVA